MNCTWANNFYSHKCLILSNTKILMSKHILSNIKGNARNYLFKNTVSDFHTPKYKHTLGQHSLDTVCATEVAVVVVAVVEDGVDDGVEVDTAGAGLLVVGVGAPTACACTWAWAWAWACA